MAPRDRSRPRGIGSRWQPALLLACGLVVGLSNCLGAAASPASAAPPVDRFDDSVLKSVHGRTTGQGAEAANAGGPSVMRVALSLGGVLALIVSTGWLYRRLIAQRRGGRGAIALVSRTLLTPRHQVLLLRAGSRLLVVGDSGHGMNLLCQITDRQEVADLLGETAEAFLDREGTAVDEAVGPAGGVDAAVFERPPSLDAARTEIRALIERVRGLGSAQPTEAPATETTR